MNLEEGGGAFDKIFIFVGRSQNKLDFELVLRLQSLGSKVEWIKIGGEGKNNLDFHLSYMLGRMDGSADKSIGFTVLSRDKGYDALLHYISENGRESRRVDNLGKAGSAAAPAAERERRPASRSRSGSSRRGRGGRASNSSRPSPSARTQTSAPAAPASPSTPSGVAESKVLNALGRLPANQRPSTKVRFLNYLQNQHGAGKALPPASDLLEALLRTGKVVVQDNRVTYQL
ncbi:MAG: hypothetical protein HY924_15820 [Elusimicrobia bacterium]|nr:hypothetical protein [Elusimicrobiota bacterium]